MDRGGGDKKKKKENFEPSVHISYFWLINLLVRYVLIWNYCPMMSVGMAILMVALASSILLYSSIVNGRRS